MAVFSSLVHWLRLYQKEPKEFVLKNHLKNTRSLFFGNF